MKPVSRTMLRIAVMSLPLLTLMACQTVAPTRTLPTWVHGIHIPMFENETFEPGLEETATRLTQYAFVADSRLDVVARDRADLVVQAVLTDWGERVAGTSGDDIVDRMEISLTAHVQLFDPWDLEDPLADLGDLVVRHGFNVDERSTYFEPEPDRRQAILRSLADQIVHRVIEGFPRQLRDLPVGTDLSRNNTLEHIDRDEIFRNQPSPSQ